MLENIRVMDIAVHEIFPRSIDRRIAQPEYASTLENLSEAAMDAFRLRITDALSARAKAVEMQIIKTGQGSFQDEARTLIGLAQPHEFLDGSQRIADKLAAAQMSQAIPGGIVIVFRGITGPLDQPFLAVIKAEMQDGFRRKRDGEEIITEFVKDLFLTRATRLYKIGFMFSEAGRTHENNTWRCLVFDHHIVASNREAAAIYFYEAFLGCGFKEDAAYETAKFFNLTREFAAKHITDRDSRHAVQDALFTYVKNEQTPTFTVDEFAERYVPMQIRDQYQTFMRNKQFPQRAVRRDTADLRGRIRKRRFKYGTDIEFSASPEAIAERRAIIDTERRMNPDTGEAAEVTVITIHDQFIKEA